ncbi:hypothetical protein EYF80_054003 [Liparis tanakae]|uniref:Uncharacterized protein n=1 Tax=Liparis tanakae TaxID=230148 RepID=A0A4Z2F500_9TELE|nr:hypothetical protein EYF80_054003 [Liparis tanakae]
MWRRALRRKQQQEHRLLGCYDVLPDRSVKTEYLPSVFPSRDVSVNHVDTSEVGVVTVTPPTGLWTDVFKL